jgi:hypothetical protein
MRKGPRTVISTGPSSRLRKGVTGHLKAKKIVSAHRRAWQPGQVAWADYPQAKRWSVQL